MKSCSLQKICICGVSVTSALCCPSVTLLKPRHTTLPILTRSHTGLLFNDGGICFTERKKVGGNWEILNGSFAYMLPLFGDSTGKAAALKREQEREEEDRDSVRLSVTARPRI